MYQIGHKSAVLTQSKAFPDVMILDQFESEAFADIKFKEYLKNKSCILKM